MKRVFTIILTVGLFVSVLGIGTAFGTTCHQEQLKNTGCYKERCVEYATKCRPVQINLCDYYRYCMIYCRDFYTQNSEEKKVDVDRNQEEDYKDNNAAKKEEYENVNATVNEYEASVYEIVNNERLAAGKKALTFDMKLCEIAKLKAKDMAEHSYFSHTSPTYGSPYDMLKASGYEYVSAGENIAKGQQSPVTVMDAWMNSEGHRANILGNYTKIGIACVEGNRGVLYWVQIFAR